jgi:hypothetical protein
VRRALALVLLASGLKLLGLEDTTMVVVLLLVVLVGPLLWMAARAHNGLPPRARILTRRWRRKHPAATPPARVVSRD